MFVPQIMYFPFLLWKSCFGLFLVDGKAASYLSLKTNLRLCVFPLCSTVVVPWLAGYCYWILDTLDTGYCGCTMVGGTSTGYWILWYYHGLVAPALDTRLLC